jgi:hypothetical protein
VSLGLSNTQYALSLSIFFITYSLTEIPSNILLKLLKPRVWFTGIMLAWGLVTTFTGFITNFRGLMVTRLVLGLAEAGLYAYSIKIKCLISQVPRGSVLPLLLVQTQGTWITSCALWLCLFPCRWIWWAISGCYFQDGGSRAETLVGVDCKHASQGCILIIKVHSGRDSNYYRRWNIILDGSGLPGRCNFSQSVRKICNYFTIEGRWSIFPQKRRSEMEVHSSRFYRLEALCWDAHQYGYCWTCLCIRFVPSQYYQ